MIYSENKESNRKKPVLHISTIHGTGTSSTRILNIKREYESVSAENVTVADPPDWANKILKNLRLANANHLICAQLNIDSVGGKTESFK